MRFILILLIAMIATIAWQSAAVATASILPGWLNTAAADKADDENTQDKKTESGDQEPECE